MGIGHLLIHTASVKRRTVTADSQGGFSESRVEQVAALPCRVSLKSANERVEAGTVKGIGMYTIYTLSGVDVKLDDHFTINSATYEITGVKRPSAGTHLEWDAERVEDAR
jgi:hypothetical protein